MSTVAKCPTCGSKAKTRVNEGEVTFQAVQDEEAFQKIGQLKNALEKSQARVAQLEQELEGIKV